MAETRPRSMRAEPREIVELRLLKSQHPELADAVDLQVELVSLQRRVQARVRTPWLEYDAKWVLEELTNAHPLLRFSDIPVEWSDLRLTMRQAADILRRYDAIDQTQSKRIDALVRTADAVQPIVVRWYEARANPTAAAANDSPADEAIEQLLPIAMRPFLTRCAEVVMQRVDLAPWSQAYCPLCGGEPELAVITHTGERRLICNRCAGQWRFPQLVCPYCHNDDRTLITSFASRDGRYRLSACDVCRRYIKAFDARSADRPVMLAVDAIATLPLDAAAMQKGYVG